MKDNRRLAIISVSFGLLEQILKAKFKIEKYVTVSGLPNKFKIVRVNDYAHNGIMFDITIESPELPKVERGALIPHINPIYHRSNR
jgi:hypothetical protein